MIWHVKDNLVNRHQGVGFDTRESDMIVFLCDCSGTHSQCLSEYIGSAWSGNILTLLPLIWGFGKRISEGFWKSLRVQIVCQSRGQVQISFSPTGALYVLMRHYDTAKTNKKRKKPSTQLFCFHSAQCYSAAIAATSSLQLRATEWQSRDVQDSGNNKQNNAVEVPKKMWTG